MRIAVHVTPRSGRDEVLGWRGSELALRVTAPADGGKANKAVCELLADTLRVRKSSVRVLRGNTSRHKHVEVEGIEETDLRRAFGKPDTGTPQ